MARSASSVANSRTIASALPHASKKARSSAARASSEALGHVFPVAKNSRQTSSAPPCTCIVTDPDRIWNSTLSSGMRLSLGVDSSINLRTRFLISSITQSIGSRITSRLKHTNDESERNAPKRLKDLERTGSRASSVGNTSFVHRDRAGRGGSAVCRTVLRLNCSVAEPWDLPL